MFSRGATAKTGRKFRYRCTDSVKAQRSIREKRKILEEKLQLDWAWMPMAAKMNEKSTNQLYWSPPIYDSNVVTAITKSAAKCPRYRSRKKKLSSSRRRGKLIADGSFIAEDAIATIESIAVHGSSTTDERITDNDQTTDGINTTKHLDCIEQSGATPPKYGSTKKKKLSSSRRRSRTAGDDSILDDTIPDDSTTDEVFSDAYISNDCIPDDSIPDAMNVTTHTLVTTQQHSSTRKKKLSSSRRRSRPSVESSIIDEVNEEGRTTAKEDDYNTYSPYDRENDPSYVNKDTNENVRYDKSQEKQHENEGVINSRTIEIDIEAKKNISNMDKGKNHHNNLTNKTPVIGQCHQCNLNKPKTLTRSPTLLKLLEKFTNLSILPGIMQTKKKDFGLRKVASEPKQTIDKKFKRPSIKVYQGYTKRPSIRSNHSIRSSNKIYNRERLFIEADSQSPTKSIVERVNSNESQSEKAESGIFEESDIDSEDKILNMENLSNIQLKTMLHNLTKVYDEKLGHRDTEIEHLRTSVQMQEKLLMQLVHITMGMKSEIDQYKKNNKCVTEFMKVSEKLSKCEHLDNQLLPNDNPGNNNINDQKTEIKSKSNVTTIKL